MLRLLFLSIFFFLTPFLQAQKIIIALGEYPPYYSKELKHFGILPNLASEIFAAEGIEVEYVWLPWARAYQGVKEGLYHASFTGAKTPQRQKVFNYSKALYNNTIVFFHHKTFDFSWQNIEDLSKERIGGTLSYAYSKEFAQAEKEGRLRVERAKSDILNIRKLLKGRITLFPISKDVGLFLLEKHFNKQKELITFHEKALKENAVHLIFSKKNVQSPFFYEAFHKGLEKVVY